MFIHHFSASFLFPSRSSSLQSSTTVAQYFKVKANFTHNWWRRTGRRSEPHVVHFVFIGNQKRLTLRTTRGKDQISSDNWQQSFTTCDSQTKVPSIITQIPHFLPAPTQSNLIIFWPVRHHSEQLTCPIIGRENSIPFRFQSSVRTSSSSNKPKTELYLFMSLFSFIRRLITTTV